MAQPDDLVSIEYVNTLQRNCFIASLKRKQEMEERPGCYEEAESKGLYLYILLAPDVQRLDNAIHRIARFVLLTFIHWIVIYTVDSVIQPLNNPGLDSMSSNVT